jgi:hypothetical protein
MCIYYNDGVDLLSDLDDDDASRALPGRLIKAPDLGIMAVPWRIQ